MKRPLLILVPFVVLIGIGLFLFLPSHQVIYALASRTVEFDFVILEEETKRPVPAATIDIWDDPLGPDERKRISQLVTDDKGIAKYVWQDVSVEDVIGISASKKLEGVTRHPEGVGTFVSRFWCTLDIAAEGYTPLEYESLSSYDYEDKGYVKKGKFHRFEFTITLRRK